MQWTYAYVYIARKQSLLYLLYYLTWNNIKLYLTPPAYDSSAVMFQSADISKETKSRTVQFSLCLSIR